MTTKELSDLAGAALVAAVGTLAGSETAAKAQAVTLAVDAIVGVVKSGLAGTLLTTEDVERHLEGILAKLADNDSAADAAVDAKFPAGED